MIAICLSNEHQSLTVKEAIRRNLLQTRAPTIWVNKSDSIVDAYRKLCAHEQSLAAVLDERQECGFVTFKDITAMLIKMYFPHLSSPSMANVSL